MKKPKERLEGRVRTALTAIEAIASDSASPQYQTTAIERMKIRDALLAQVNGVMQVLAQQADDAGFKL